MNKHREKSRGSQSFISLSTESANIKAVKEVVHNFEEARKSTISNGADRAQVESSLKLVRDLITIIVSDESNLDKLEHIIEKRASRVSRAEHGLSILGLRDPNRLSIGRSHSSLTGEQSKPLLENQKRTSFLENKENLKEDQQKENTQGMLQKEYSQVEQQKEDSQEEQQKEDSQEEKQKEDSQEEKQKEDSQEEHQNEDIQEEQQKEDSREEQQKEDSQEEQQKENTQYSENKQITETVLSVQAADVLAEEELNDDIVLNTISPQVSSYVSNEVEIIEAGTQTSNYELYEELSKRITEIRDGEKSTSDLLAKVMPIRDSLKAISEILSGLIENKDNLANKEMNDDHQLKQITDVQPIEGRIEGPVVGPVVGPTEEATEDDVNNLAYYVFYDISEDKRLQAWQRTLDAREKIAEHIIAQTGKRPAEILFNRMSTMEVREKQMIQRLMDYADRMNPTQRSARPTSRLRGYVNERNMHVREIQETVPRPRKRDIEINGVPNIVQQEFMRGSQNCPEPRTQWMSSDVLAQRIREKRRDLKRVIDYYPDISHLSVAGQKKPIQFLSFQEIQKRSREIAEKACANHLNSCFCNPAYGAGTSARVGSISEPEVRTQ